MTKPIIEEDTLSSDHKVATIWQQVDDGVPEQAIHARTWDGGDNARLIELKQGDGSVLLNGETIRELSKLLIRWIG